MNLYYSIALGAITGIMFMYGMLLPEVEVKANEEVIEVKYATDRETHLYNKVEKTVDLPGFGDYQDLLASYAYNTCKKVISDTGKYSCENLVKTWNAENGGWKWNATNTANKNGTHDGGLCQLNSQRHGKFIKSERFNNPLAQLDYCLQVWQDAKKKNTMPWFAFYKKEQRDRGIKFIGKTLVVEGSSKKVNYYAIAVEKQKRYNEAKIEAYKAREVCKEKQDCK